MFDHEPERFREPENGVCRFAPGIGEVLDREKGSVNVVMPVDQKQLHFVNVTEQRPFPIFMLMILIMILIL